MPHKAPIPKNKKTTMGAPWLVPAMVVLALLAIASTLLPAEAQQRPALLGMPIILWGWFGISLLSIVLIALSAWQIIRGSNDV